MNTLLSVLNLVELVATVQPAQQRLLPMCDGIV